MVNGEMVNSEIVKWLNSRLALFHHFTISPFHQNEKPPAVARGFSN